MNTGCGADCDGYADELSGPPLVLRIHNTQTTPLYLGTSGCTHEIMPFSVSSADGSELSLRLVGCGTCESRQESSGMCSTMCAVPPTILVAPTGSYELTWSALHYVQAAMPESCYLDYPSDSCSQRVSLAAGSYQLTTYAYPGCDDSPSGSCTCDSSTEGWCQLPGFSGPSGAPLEIGQTIEIPPSAPIEITF